jgi:hypothetical protein
VSRPPLRAEHVLAALCRHGVKYLVIGAFAYYDDLVGCARNVVINQTRV